MEKKSKSSNKSKKSWILIIQTFPVIFSSNLFLLKWNNDGELTKFIDFV